VLLQIDANRAGLIPTPGDQRINVPNYQRGQLALIKSRVVLNAALKRPGVAELAMLRDKSDPAAWLEKQLRADFSVAPEVLRLSLAGEDPVEIAVLLGAVRDAYLDEIVEKERRPQVERLERLKKVYEEYTAVLADRRQAARELAEGLGASDPAALGLKQQFALERLGELQKELKQIQGELRQARLDLAGSQGKESAAGDDAAVEELVQKDSGVVRLADEAAKAEQAADEFLRAARRGEEEPEAKALLSRRDAARQALAERRQAVRPAAVAQVREKVRAEARVRQAEVQARVKFLEGQETLTRGQVEQTTAGIAALNKGSLRLAELRAETAGAEDVTKKVEAQIEAAKVDLLTPPRVTALEDPVDVGAEGKDRRLVAAGAGLAALAAVVFLVGYRENRARRVGTGVEVTREIGLSLVGSLPPLPHRLRPAAAARPAALAAGTARSVLIESADAMSVVVQRAAREEGLRVFMVTSAESGEGKTSLAGQLAASLARAGHRTLLVDGDMRRPSLHAQFDLAPTPGLGDVLLGTADESAARPTGLADLDVLPAGAWDDAVVRALAGERLAAALSRFRSSYEFVIIDTPPVLAVPDALFIGQHADAALFSVLRDVSRIPIVAAACERAEALGIRVFGAVLSGVVGESYGAYPGYAPRPTLAG
jgi:capsular exopolysaccharide synthesis family protein